MMVGLGIRCKFEFEWTKQNRRIRATETGQNFISVMSWRHKSSTRYNKKRDVF